MDISLTKLPWYGQIGAFVALSAVGVGLFYYYYEAPARTEVAARALRQRDWHGVVVKELLGERDLTFAEATRIIGARIGRPDLPYVQFPYDDFRASLVQMGISPSVAGLYAEMARAINDGRIRSLEGRRPENTTPTTFEAFADTLMPAYQTA